LIHLPLALAETGAIFVGVLSYAMLALHALFKGGMMALVFIERATTGAAEYVRAFDQAVADRDTFIEHKAVAAPKTLLWRHGLQILQDPTFKVIDLLNPLSDEITG
jgi:hypothetical protein